ncbi:MAG: hypothetical protein HY515_01440 [Candidatus Aenigmarchaeota archaeon]|nr:hypothetical protein [Candidatus Aenigmarchaeota archaeon]
MRRRELGRVHFELTPFLRIHIKTLYEWLYHLKEHLEKSETIRALISPSLWLRLKAICDFRSLIITHPDLSLSNASAGLRSTGNHKKVELILMSPNPSPLTLNQLEQLFYECVEELDPTDREEKNFFERAAILYRNLDRFRDSRRAKVVSFIRKNGAITDTPLQLATFIHQLAWELVPKLHAL